MISIKIFFSFNLRHFDNLKETNVTHRYGRVEIFNAELMAIAGYDTRAVEIMRNGQWEIIKPVGNRNGDLYLFSSLTIPGNPSDTLFVFGSHILTVFIFNNLN